MSDPDNDRMCDRVAERVALGEPLGDAAAHAESCVRCRRIAALPTELGAVTREADPGAGFTARMTAGAQHRIVVRQRRRVAAAAVSAAAAASLLTFALTRSPERDVPPANQAAADLGSHEQPPGEDVSDEAEALRALARFADTERALRFSANWRDIEAPLSPYRKLVEGVE